LIQQSLQVVDLAWSRSRSIRTVHKDHTKSMKSM
jgi:hypothetical protein